ncbi:hypothetical protein ACIQGZ_27500 [Streptomyces sp. NPDC092296]|uniref:hypothetical protein n=1 Tax=Streptomyces sp. NPDC092296 TaxID=3366012 RepID=UPI00381B7FAF
MERLTTTRRTCLDVPLTRLADRPIRDKTYAEYLKTLKHLGIENLPFEEATVRFLTNRLDTVFNPGTRRKHSIALRASLGIKLPCPKAPQKVYDLQTIEKIHEVFEKSMYRPWVMTMLHSGARLGESCVKQPIKGNIIDFDRQRLPDGAISTPKTAGPVVVADWFAAEYTEYDLDKNQNSVYVGIRRAGKRAGLTLNPHQFRHMFANEIVTLGGHPEMLRRQMRHHDVSVSLRYYVQTTEADIMDVMTRFGGEPQLPKHP